MKGALGKTVQSELRRGRSKDDVTKALMARGHTADTARFLVDRAHTELVDFRSERRLATWLMVLLSLGFILCALAVWTVR